MENLAETLRRRIERISVERNVLRAYEALKDVENFIKSSLRDMGYKVGVQPYETEGKEVANVWAELEGVGDEVLIVGAHYDSVVHSPGANDNGTGVSCLLLLAERLRRSRFRRRVRFVFFVNEEPPYFQTSQMGSYLYARSLKGEKVVGMLSLETIGYYTDRPNSQDYPLNFLFRMKYPSTGNFLAFVGNPSSAKLLNRSISLFRETVSFPAEGGAYPECIPGVGWSDQWSFWRVGIPAIMLTDTAPFRYPYYHSSEDTPDKINYPALAEVYRGIEGVVRGLAQDTESYR